MTKRVAGVVEHRLPESVLRVDAVHARALAAGAPTDQFDGDRRGTLVDPFGHVWAVATRKEEVSYEELTRRFAKAIAAKGVAP